jgi:2-polyprenyl-6-methoxyphenol hydroxylase-like FAD-dependent oxidoreductase
MASPAKLSDLPDRTDVLVVGAGPAGLTMAVSLAQLGVDCVIIDRKPGVAAGSKAAAVQPRTLEYLHRVGVATPLVDDGIRGDGFTAKDGDRTLLRASYGSLYSPYPYLLLVGQQQTEYRLEQRLQALGGVVHRSVRMLSMVEDFPGSTVTVAGAEGGVRAIHARYVIGCDGVHSTVRQRAGIGFRGHAPEQLFALADVELERWPTEDPEAIFYFSAHGLLLVSPLPGRQMRVVASVSDPNTNLTADDVEQLLSMRGSSSLDSPRVRRVVAASTHQVQQRVAEQLSTSNIFLAGDAAHTHSPAGGQGMNTGIQDAGNLAWKLEAVLSGRAAPGLLDTYATERRPVAERVIAFTSQLTSLATLPDPDQVTLRNDAIAAVAAVPNAQDWLARHLSQLDIAYSDRSDTDELSAGQRVPPELCPADDLSWTIIAPDEDMMDHLEGVAIISSVPVPRTIFVRPDGYVASEAMISELFGIGRVARKGEQNITGSRLSV